MGLLNVVESLQGAFKAGNAFLETRTGLTGAQRWALGFGVYNFYSTIHNKNLTPEQKRQEAFTGVAITALTLGIKNGFTQQVAGVALNLAPHLPSMSRALVGSYRAALDQRSMAAIPFSYSSAPMDIAYQTLNVGMSKINDARGYQGSEAAMYAAKYISGKYISKTSVY